jgi:hypothetical protein
LQFESIVYPEVQLAQVEKSEHLSQFMKGHLLQSDSRTQPSVHEALHGEQLDPNKK